MKITFIGHASILIESGGVSILSDPWWKGPCFGAQWWNYPEADQSALRDKSIDYIYISHGHHDHFHPGTLSLLPRTAKVLVGATTDLAEPIAKMGFEVLSIGVDEERHLTADLKCRLMPTHGDDTLLAVSDGKEVCINLNDALHSASSEVKRRYIDRLKVLYPTIDYVFCGYGVASHFPNCYVIPGANREATAAKRQLYFNSQWAGIIGELNPKFGFPFAADVVFYENDLFWANEPTHNSDRPVQAFERLWPKSQVQTIDIAPGFCVDTGSIVNDVRRARILRADLLRKQNEIHRANAYGSVDPAKLVDVAKAIGASLKRNMPYFSGFAGDYRILIAIRNSNRGVEIIKERDNVRSSIVDDTEPASYDLIYKTRLSYLRWCFTQPYGDEVLFVGSGGIFEYRNVAMVEKGLQGEVMQLFRAHDRDLGPRAQHSPVVTRLKSIVKAVLRRPKPLDLYDLRQWAVMD